MNKIDRPSGTVLRIAHMADIHAGYKATSLVNAQGINLREADGYVALSKIVSEIIQNEADVAIICGDVFHTPAPEIRAIVFVQNQLRRLASAGIKVYALAGNHDTNDIRADIAASKVLDDPWRHIYSYAEPYVKPEIADGIHLHMVSHHMYGDQSHTMSQVKPVSGEINIFSTHGSCIDPILQEKLHAEHSPREIVIPDGLLTGNDWSYTMLGHIHERGWLGSRDKKTDTAKSKIYYNGSIIRRGFSDKPVPLGRGWTIWDIDTSGKFTAVPMTIAQRPQVDFLAIQAANISASDITDKIVENLKSTQTNGTNFDTRIAPILRQKLEGITPAKYAALDWKALSQNAEHAMVFKFDPTYLGSEVEKVLDSEGNEITAAISISDNADVLKVYDEWANKSKTVKDLEKDMKKQVTKQARDFVKMGQEETLDAG